MTARAEKKPKAKANDRSRGRVLLITDEDHAQFMEAIAAAGLTVPPSMFVPGQEPQQPQQKAPARGERVDGKRSLWG